MQGRANLLAFVVRYSSFLWLVSAQQCPQDECNSEEISLLQGQVQVRTPITRKTHVLARTIDASPNATSSGGSKKKGGSGIIPEDDIRSMPSWLCWVVLFGCIFLVVLGAGAVFYIYTLMMPKCAKEWEERGDAYTLFLSTAQGLLYQVAMLTLIVLEVFSFHNTKNPYVMTCNPFKVGWVATWACEYAKAYVRSFPLVASMVTLLAASRILMMQYLYYEMLKRGAFLSFGKFSAFSDPLYRIMLWCCANCFINFILKASTDAGLQLLHPHSVISSLTGSGTFLDSMHRMVYFFLPAVLYFKFLATAYDVEESLVPLSKYMKDDSEEAHDAKRMLSDMTYLLEADVADALHEEQELINAIPEVADDAYKKLIKAGQKNVLTDKSRKLVEAGQKKALTDKSSSEEGLEGRSDQILSYWRLLNLWPAPFLLQNQWDDDHSRRFRRTWVFMSCINISVMAGVFFYFVRALQEKILDVADGQQTDILGAVVLFAHIVLTLFLAALVLKGAILPFRRRS